MFGFVGSIVGVVVDKLVGPIFGYLNKKQDVSLEKYKAMTAAERAEYADYVKGLNESNLAKVSNNKSTASHAMVYLFGVPAAVHWAAVFGVTTFPSLFNWFGIMSVAALPKGYESAELAIALSFFILSAVQKR